MNPCELVRLTCKHVAEISKHVKIDKTNLKILTQSISSEIWQHLNEAEQSLAVGDEIVSEDGYLETLFTTWNLDGWHYQKPVEQPELTARYILVLSALNFCFWPTDALDNPFDYCNLAINLRKTLENDKNAFSCDSLKNLTAQKLSSWLLQDEAHQKENENEETQAAYVPLLSERVRLLQEIGEVIASKFQGSVAKFVESAKQSAAKLVELMVENFPGFRDHCIHPTEGFQVFLYKRAQIFVADLWGCFGGQGLGKFNDIKQLTMFADYRVPQILRHWKVLTYSDELSQILKKSSESETLPTVAPGSIYEVEIRAATLAAVEEMKTILEDLFRIRIPSVELDWWLWQRAEKIKEKMEPHHKTLTIYY